MSDITAQDVQKLLTEVIRKQMVILGPQITLLKTRNVASLSVADDGSVIAVSETPQITVTQFLEQFRDLSAPLVMMTMKPLLSTLSPAAPPTVTVKPDMAAAITQETHTHEALVPKT